MGLSLVRQRIDEGSVCPSTECADVAGVSLQGFEFGSFLAFGEPFAGDRIQVGMHVGAGAGWYRGVVPYRGEDTDVSELLTFQNQSIPIPIFRAEFAVAATVAPGLKIIGSGGYGFPGQPPPHRERGLLPAGRPLTGPGDESTRALGRHGQRARTAATPGGPGKRR